MRLRVSYYGAFGKIAGQRQEEIELPLGAALPQLMAELAQRYGSAFVAAAKDRTHRSILIDGCCYARGDEGDITLKEGQEIAFLQVMIGG